MLAYRRIGITMKSDLADQDSFLRSFVKILRNEGVEILLDPETITLPWCTKAFSHYTAESPMDALVVIGGDGTILRAARETAFRNVPILGINKGSVGFLAEVSIQEIAEKLPFLLHGGGMEEIRSLLSVQVMRGEASIFESIALNDAVVAQGAIARLLDLRTMVDGETLATYHADGLIISTPTGSTAYSLAAGGPVVHPRLPAIILTPINPHSFTQKPIVLPSDCTIRTQVLQRSSTFIDSHVSLTIDGQLYQELIPHDTIQVSHSDRHVRFIRTKDDTFFRTLRTKLKWGERIEE